MPELVKVLVGSQRTSKGGAGSNPVPTAKYCSKCNTTKPAIEFSFDKSQRDGLAFYCKPCLRECRRLSYHHTKPNSNAKKRKHSRYTTLREWILSYLLQHPCVDCGETDPIVLEFDHVRGVKVTEVSKLLAKVCGLKMLEDEVAKCDVRCANCHRRMTAKRAKQWLWIRLESRSPV